MSTPLHPVIENHELCAAFRRFIDQRLFPCVGAKSALAHRAIEVVPARDIRSAWDDLAVHERLCAFSDALADSTSGLRSFAVVFGGPHHLTEAEFETALWERLQSLRDKDRWLSYTHDPAVARDPASPDFAYSVGGAAYFVVGMHPRASRVSRRTPMPALVFNPFAQFERLRQDGAFDRMSSVIKKRDLAVCGSENPMLADHGETSAARQFSGRAVEDSWTCPFSPERS
jgi:FPC/CPF motif-containing protein YcgG